MKIKLIDYGYKSMPLRAHSNDAGADVYSTIDCVLQAHESKKIPLGLGIRLPDGYVAFVCPRSGLSSKGITCELAPIDSGYTGEIHAIVTNNTNEAFKINVGDRVGQLVIMPVVLCDFVDEKDVVENSRGANGFGSTGH
jgi:dUTP pyrophosphatase